MKNRINKLKTLDEPGGNPIGDGLVILAGIMARKYLTVKGIRNDESWTAPL